MFFYRPIIQQSMDDAPMHTSNSLKWLWFLIKPYKWLFLLLTANRGGRMVLSIGVYPLIIAKIIDAFETGIAFDNPSIVWQLLGIFITISAISHLLLIIALDDLRFFERLSRNVRLISLKHLNQLSAHWHEQTDSGSKLQCVMTGSNGVKFLIRIYFQQFLWFIAGLIGTSIALYFMDVSQKYILFFLGYMLMYMAFSCWFNIIIGRGYNVRNVLLEDLIGKVYEFVNAAFTVKTFTLGNHILNQAQKGEQTGYDQVDRYYAIDIYTWVILLFISLLWVSVILYTAIHEALAGEITIAALALVTYQAIKISNLTEDFTHVHKQYVDFNSGFKRLIELLQQPVEIENITQDKLVIKDSKITFNAIDFAYDEKNTVFSGLNLTIQPKEKIGIVGRSGSGKSTLVKLLLRFYDPSKNEILIDDQNIKNVDQDSLRQNIAVIPQDVSLFNHSILDNIRYGCLTATDEEVKEAARLAHADEFIQKLPEGYNTLVGERGLKLSGGQRQRIAIARAILKDAPILVLDEATSALDTESEQLIQESLNTLMQEKTVIVIAHRLSTISSLDRILVFDQGKIVEQGNHTELLKSKGLYHQLWSMQSHGIIKD